MRMPSIINQTAISCAEGAAYGAAYGALINPVMGVGAGAVLGAVALSSRFLLGEAVGLLSPRQSATQADSASLPTAPAEISIEDRIANIGRQLVSSINTMNRIKKIESIFLIFLAAVVISAGFTLPSYAGLYAGKYALAALGFKATIAPSLSLAAKVALAHLAVSLGVEWTILSANARWNRTFPRAPQSLVAADR